ncbi:hypothetical protein D3C78_1017740 [compost metagenome]
MVAEQRQLAQASLQGDRLVDIDQQVELAVAQLLQGIAAAALVEAHLPFLFARGQQGVQQQRLEAVHATDAQRPLRLLVVHRRHLREALAQAVECAAHMLGQAMRDESRGDTEMRFDEQRVAAKAAQPAQGVAHRRLREAHDRRRAGDAELCIDGVEGQQHVEVEFA